MLRDSALSCAPGDRSRNTEMQVHAPVLIGSYPRLLGLPSQSTPPGWFKQQTSMSLPCWRLEGQGQSVDGGDFFRGLSPWLADGRLLLASSQNLPSVQVCVLTPAAYQSYWMRARSYDLMES